jgi:hypothetical protein
MSNRGRFEFLLGVAIIVWGIAVLMGVFVAAPLLFGMHLDAGLIVNALAAFGAFAAAAAAVWVATTDRRERKQERDAEDETQARMVLVLPRRPSNPLELQIQVTNHSSGVIMDLTFIGLAVEGHDLDDLKPTLGPFPVIAPPSASSPPGAGPLAGSSLFTFNPEGYGPTHPYYIAVRGGPNNEPQTITGSTLLTATIQWTDARGKTWRRSGSGPADGSKLELGTPVRAAPV